MAETRATIPDRESFKAAEVCEIAGVQPFVLRSWELEFPAIGTARSPGGPRLYRRADVERILRIKDLVFNEGLTLAGARRRLEDEEAQADGPPVAPVLDAAARERLGQVKDGLRALLVMLESPPAQGAGGWPPAPKPGVRAFEGAGGAVEAPAAGASKGTRKRLAKS